MRSVLLTLTVAMLSLPAAAQVSVEVSIPVPTIRFEAPPPLVVVQPGVQIVQSSDEEVYFVQNAYWVRRRNVWYRSRDHRGHWEAVPVRVVPVEVTRIPTGRYARYHAGHHRGRWREDDGDHWVPPGHRRHHGRDHDD